MLSGKVSREIRRPRKAFSHSRTNICPGGVINQALEADLLAQWSGLTNEPGKARFSLLIPRELPTTPILMSSHSDLHGGRRIRRFSAIDDSTWTHKTDALDMRI